MFDACFKEVYVCALGRDIEAQRLRPVQRVHFFAVQMLGCRIQCLGLGFQFYIFCIRLSAERLRGS